MAKAGHHLKNAGRLMKLAAVMDRKTGFLSMGCCGSGCCIFSVLHPGRSDVFNHLRAAARKVDDKLDQLLLQLAD
jgi:hypothetical protein